MSEPWVQLMDYTGVAVFSATGALLASYRRLDIVAFVFFAAITGVGGGTLRDLILGVPVFWIEDTLYILICTATAFLVYLAAHWIEPWQKWLLWMDALGLSVFSSIGAGKGLAITGSPVIAIIAGVLGATFGGILRDILAGQPSVILRQEIYVSAAAIGSLAYVLTECVSEGNKLATLAGFLGAFLLRASALGLGWSLPSWKPPAGM